MQGKSSTHQGTKHTKTWVPKCGVHVAPKGGGGGPDEGVGGHVEAQGGASGEVRTILVMALVMMTFTREPVVTMGTVHRKSRVSVKL